jgi:hypothetical protein
MPPTSLTSVEDLMRDNQEAYDDDYRDSATRGRHRDEYDSVYRRSDDYDSREDRYDSHYDEGEDPVAFVNVIDMDIPFFQLVWLIFKIMLAAIVAAGILYLLGALLHWVLSLPQVQQILPDGANWLSGLLDRAL